jgi:hypothetical protein
MVVGFVYYLLSAPIISDIKGRYDSDAVFQSDHLYFKKHSNRKGCKGLKVFHKKNPRVPLREELGGLGLENSAAVTIVPEVSGRKPLPNKVCGERFTFA